MHAKAIAFPRYSPKQPCSLSKLRRSAKQFTAEFCRSRISLPPRISFFFQNESSLRDQKIVFIVAICHRYIIRNYFLSMGSPIWLHSTLCHGKHDQNAGIVVIILRQVIANAGNATMQYGGLHYDDLLRCSYISGSPVSHSPSKHNSTNAVWLLLFGLSSGRG